MSRVKLYCLAHAGASATIYLTWRRHLDPRIELVPVELSGRGRRIASSLHDGFGEALEDAAHEIAASGPEDGYALFGHSFGGLLAFETAHLLVARGHPAPRHLFISASCAPERVKDLDIVLTDRNRDLLKSLAHLGGTPSEILADAEAVDLFAPILRADLRALLDYRYVPKDRLPCDISILLGADDTVASAVDAALWAKLAAGTAVTRILRGGHFATFEAVEAVSSHLNETLVWGVGAPLPAASTR